MQLRSPVRYLAVAPFTSDGVEVPAGPYKGYRAPAAGQYYLQSPGEWEALDRESGEFGGAGTKRYGRGRSWLA